MKFLTFVPMLLAATPSLHAFPIVERQTSSTSNELEDGKCGKVVFIFARGSTEIGNMGSTVGPPTCRALKKEYGDDEVACQGVGGAYTANIASNTLPSGTTSAGIKEGTSMYTLAAKQCPDAAIVGSGYSQGAALTAAVITDLDDAVKKQTKGAVLYGYTKNKQNDGQIPEYPADQTKVFCNASDGVCGGMLAVTPGHMTYTADVEDAVAFLKPLIG